MTRMVFALLLAAACDDTLFGPPFIEGEGATYEADWAGVEAMFDDHCVSCHPALNPFVLDTLRADVTSGAGKYVVAGDAEGSMLWRIVANQRFDGDVPLMPLGSQGLSAADHAGLKAWIDDGALLPEGD